MGEGGCIQGFGEKPEGKKLLGKPMCRWDGKIKMDFQEVGWRYGLDCSGSG